MADKDLLNKLVKQYGTDREALMPILQDYVVEHQFLDDETMVDIADLLDISAADVYGTASFYSFLGSKPLGKNVIRVCKTISCDMKGKKEIIEALEDILKIKVGGTTCDNKFSLLETNCIGWCHKAPAMLINDTPYTELTPQSVSEIIEEYQKK